jgi:hypothetical protein
MVKDANTLVEDLVSVFLEANMEHLNILMSATENVIHTNNKNIIEFLENNNVDTNLIMELKTCLKI